MLFTGTDSLAYEIEANKVYEDFYKNNTMLNFSG